uniref:glucan endo-1,3-beta-D-glucosidase n=1 Tax=Anthurium amnicola TaxID=1678845 RepID=A0A1D1Y8Z7_9ARAE
MPRSASMVAFLLLLLGGLPPPGCRVGAVGVNWGTASSHPLPPAKVVAGLLRANNISRVKLSDADPVVLESLSGTSIGVVVGIPNEMLSGLNASRKAAETWVHDNVTRYVSGNAGGSGVRIEYVAVGDEPFLLSYGQRYSPFVIGAANNVQLALIGAKLANRVKVIVPCNADAYRTDSSLPSKGHFRPDLNRTMIQLLTFLTKHGSPFVVDIYPFVSIQQNKNFSMELALFQPVSHPLTDRHNKYENIFDASIDTLVTSLSSVGFGDMDIIVGKIGWPTDGAVNASAFNAQIFMKGLLDHLRSKSGTPLRPKSFPMETYVFSLLDEDLRNLTNGNFERHWGIFTFDGQAKYNVDLGQGLRNLANAQNVDYLALRWCVLNNNKDLSNVSLSALDACSVADCSALSVGGSCSNITWPGNVSYAYNSYYQQHDQSPDSCDFGGMGLITTVDPSVGECRFPVEIRTSFSISLQETLFLWWSTILAVGVKLCLFGPTWKQYLLAF